MDDMRKYTRKNILESILIEGWLGILIYNYYKKVFTGIHLLRELSKYFSTQVLITEYYGVI